MHQFFIDFVLWSVQSWFKTKKKSVIWETLWRSTSMLNLNSIKILMIQMNNNNMEILYDHYLYSAQSQVDSERQYNL